MTPSPLVDSFHRTVTYLRVSVTDRFNFRCAYCMPENMTFLSKRDLLTLEEFETISTAFIRLGVRKLRVTGGEPLVRRNILSYMRAVSRHLESGALDELTLTSNGSQLHRFSEDLVAMGVRRVNISLDTLDEAKFSRISRNGRLSEVLRGIDAARAAGLRIKINAVALKGFNEDEVFRLVDWCAARDMDLTFIEVMPMGDLGEITQLGQYWPLSEVRALLGTRYRLVDSAERTGGPARYVRLEESGQKIGFITPLTHSFCESCNRVRLTCDGKLHLCLGQEGHVDLRAVLRDPAAPSLEDAIRAAVARKPEGHDFDYSHRRARGQTTHRMNLTGG